MSISQHKKELVYQQLKEDILLGKFPAETKLPKEIDFAKQLGVGKITLRSALARLDADGLIARVPAKGTFVLDGNKNNSKQQKILIIGESPYSLESPNNYIIPGIEKSATQLGYKTVMCDLKFINSQSIDELKKSFKANNVFGIILAGSNFIGDEPIVKKLQVLKLPVVLPHGGTTDPSITGFATIRTLQDKAWVDAIRHLHDQGHKNVATIVLRKDGFRGFSEEEHLTLLKAYNMSTAKSLLGYAPYNQAAISKIVFEWLQLPEPPTAILCFSDFVAIRVYDALKKANIMIPEDIAVMGCCGYPGGSFASPPLSTIDFEYSEQGKLSIELLINAKKWFNPEDKSSAPIMIKKHKLLIRASSDYKVPEQQYMQRELYALEA
jgi:DNA-binding LacI/PurR family transcriptional regulator